MELNLINEKGKATSKVSASDAAFGREFNEALVHQVITAYLANGRQGTRAQKARGDVNKSNKKPWRQKGTGRARAGRASSPLWRGGGKIFPNLPDENFEHKINRRMYRAGLSAILSQLAREERLAVVEQFTVDEPKTKALAEKLKGMQPKPGEGTTPKEGQQLGQLGEQQGQLEERLRQVQEKLKELDEKMPGMGEEMREPLEQAAKSMGEAKQQLDQKLPKGAQEKQQEALEKLQEAQQQLDEKMQQQQQQQQGNEDAVGVGDPKNKVGIPKNDPYASPRNLREEIMKAMGERAPDAYKDAIRKFYEELTK